MSGLGWPGGAGLRAWETWPLPTRQMSVRLPGPLDSVYCPRTPLGATGNAMVSGAGLGGSHGRTLREVGPGRVLGLSPPPGNHRALGSHGLCIGSPGPGGALALLSLWGTGWRREPESWVASFLGGRERDPG